jgi:hypothetical protein
VATVLVNVVMVEMALPPLLPPLFFLIFTFSHHKFLILFLLVSSFFTFFHQGAAAVTIPIANSIAPSDRIHFMAMYTKVDGWLGWFIDCGWSVRLFVGCQVNAS